ncbi:MAG: hypothetical protein WB772_19995 [Xanthobacteraceae bacterium]
MFSTFLTDVLQDLLKESFPKFAYWLFYSEMALALLLGILFCFAWPVGTLASRANYNGSQTEVIREALTEHIHGRLSREPILQSRFNEARRKRLEGEAS